MIRTTVGLHESSTSTRFTRSTSH